MIFIALILGILAFVIEIIFYPTLIVHLQKIKFSQIERTDGPESHIAKNGTPTMGGSLFVPFIVIISFLLSIYKPEFIQVSILTLLFGTIGFYDDYSKVIKKDPNAFKAKEKFIMQIICTIIYLFLTFIIMRSEDSMILPFCKQTYISFTFLTFPILAFIIIAVDNAANLTDGIDGLLTCMTIIVSIFFIFVSIKQYNEYYLIPTVVLFILCGFLLFNKNKAKIFMGDTGSLALGGYIASMSILLKIELYIPLFAFVYLAETLSVILQVSYFKITNGKRLFKMTPIHHHFEKCKWSENIIVFIFSLVTAICCYITYILI